MIAEMNPSTSPRKGNQQSQGGGVNWEFVDSFDPREISEKHQTAVVKQFVKGFKKFKIPDKREDLDHPLICKLVKLCQVSCEVFVEGAIQYKKASEKQNEVISILKEKYSALEASYSKARSLLDQLKGEIHPCPVCNHLFKSPEYLDKHFQKSHPQMIHSWNNIRTGTPDSFATTHEDISKQIRQINQTVSGNELQKNFIVRPPPQESKKDKQVLETKSQKPRVTFFNEKDPSDDEIRVIPTIQQALNTQVMEDITSSEIQPAKTKRKTRVKRKEKTPPSSPQQNEVKELDSSNDKDRDGIDELAANQNKEKNVDKVKATEEQSVDDGVIHTTMIEPSGLDIFYENTPEFSYIQMGAFDESTFVDDEPPILGH